MSDITIYHNPACGTSRNTLALIREAGIEPEVIEYLKTPPARATLEAIAEAVGGARALLRDKGDLYTELGLAEDRWTDAQLLDAIEQHPALMNRPVVRSPRGTRLCRPAETVKALL